MPGNFPGLAVFVVALTLSGGQAGAEGPGTVAGLTAALIGAGSSTDREDLVRQSRGGQLSDLQIANALGRASASLGAPGEFEYLLAGLIEPSPDQERGTRAAYEAGLRTADLLADYRGLTNTPWGGSGGATGGRNR